MSKESSKSSNIHQEKHAFDGFEASMDQLKVHVARLRDHQLTLSEAMASYREGVALAKRCQKQLREAEQVVQIMDDEADAFRAAASVAGESALAGSLSSAQEEEGI